VRAVSTFPEFLLSEQVLKALKWLAPQGLNSMEYVHHVGLDMGVFIGLYKKFVSKFESKKGKK
jgi:hypothetical protein